ncbi:hypothetical protein C4J65_29325 [Streptomyces sp. CB09001]|uniref:hypothetical protein n=1 Tax=Streptomyces sp. CB09001 TaxID=2083284 RepID=UPI000E21539E|nr:hypothetical protein [Streptomyces sp. CB09001]AXL91937.1 hypothetical protein C4J65_29325 [Streptomyces sp. CB09001]
MTESLLRDNQSNYDAAVHTLAELLNADFGDWELATVRELAGSRPTWQLGKVYDGQVVVTPGCPGTDLVLDAGKLGFESTRYTFGQVPLLDHPYRSRPGGAAASRTAGLAQALAAVGDPVRYEDCGGAPGLRWHGERHTVIFQSSRRGSNLWVHPVSPLHGGAAERAEAMRDGGRPGERESVLSYPSGATLVERRAAFGELYDAVVGRIGHPTLYGGSATGPGVRWRDERRLLALNGDRAGAWLEVHDTEELETEEHRTFKWGGPWNAEEPPDYTHLPYLWQLHRGGPGWSPSVYPGGRLAPDLGHLLEALTLLLGSLVEHLPPQVGLNWAGLVITHRNRDSVRVAFDPEAGLRVLRTDRAQEDSAERAEAMRAMGWRTRERWGWSTAFPETDEDFAERAARLIVDQLRADGVTLPGEECGLRDVTCNDSGTLDLYGAGIGR